MARVKGPLMSMTASGSIAGGAIQFKAGRNGAQVVIPALGKARRSLDPSPQQTTQRADFASIAAEWRTLGPVARAWWHRQAKGGTAPNGWNLYLSERLYELRHPPNMLMCPNGAPIIDPNGRTLTV